MNDFSQMTPEEKRAWALGQAILKSSIDDDPGATVKRAEAFYAYVFTSGSEPLRSVPLLHEAS